MAATAGMLLATAAALPASAGQPAVPDVEHPTAADLGPGFTEGKVWAMGDQMHYVKGGDGPVLVLLHGWPQTWWVWHKVMPDLAEDFTVIAFDLPGLGQSEPSQWGYDKAAVATQVRQAAWALGYHKIDVIGHDLGGLVAYPLAEQYPWSVDRIAVLDTPLSGYGLEDVYDISWHFLFNMSPYPIPETIMDDGEDVKTYLDMMFDGTPNPGLIDRDVYISAYNDADVRHAGYEYYRAFEEDAQWNQAAASNPIDQPVLAMGAEAAFGPMVGMSLDNVASDVSPVVVPDSGHFIAEENPEFFVDCVSLFFGATSTPASPELAACAP